MVRPLSGAVASPIPRTCYLHGILLLALLLALGLTAALAWQWTLALLSKDREHRLRNSRCSMFLVLSQEKLRQIVAKQFTSMQGLRLTVLTPQWHLLQLGWLDLIWLTLTRKLALYLAQESLVRPTLRLLVRQAEVVRSFRFLALTPENEDSIEVTRKNIKSRRTTTV